jgi:hypothetical protein
MSRDFPGKNYGIPVSAYERFEFPAVEENICRKLIRTAISQQQEGTGRGQEDV